MADQGGIFCIFFTTPAAKRKVRCTCTFPPSILRKLREQQADLELGLEEVFSASVSTAVGEAAAAPASPELVAAIVLGALLAGTFVVFLAYVLLDLKRKRYRGLTLTMSFTFIHHSQLMGLMKRQLKKCVSDKLPAFAGSITQDLLCWMHHIKLKGVSSCVWHTAKSETNTSETEKCGQQKL